MKVKVSLYLLLLVLAAAQVYSLPQCECNNGGYPADGCDLGSPDCDNVGCSFNDPYNEGVCAPEFSGFSAPIALVVVILAGFVYYKLRK